MPPVKNACGTGRWRRAVITFFGAALCSGSSGWAEDRVEPASVSSRIDALFEEAWAEAGLNPSPSADDATFLRRVTLDLTGVIPEIAEARRFLFRHDDAKKDDLIDDLLGGPRHATHLANIWRDVLLPRQFSGPAAAGFTQWLRARFSSNVPYDRLVRELLLARGGLAQSPPVHYYVAHDSKPETLAASSSRVFLGIQIHCAQCHDHPFADWEQNDFWSYAAFFARVRGPSRNGGPNRLDEGPSGEVRHPVNKQTVAPRFLDGSTVSTATAEPRRAMLTRWVTDRKNPYFAKAAVNRVWWVMFGRGLVDPVDDQGTHNPPTHADVLELLADDFVAHDYDLRRVFRVVARTRVYQLSSQKSEGGGESLLTYTSMPVRSLSADEIFDSLVQAAGRRTSSTEERHVLNRQRTEFVAQVEAPTRTAIQFEGGIPQTLALLNGAFVEELTAPATSDLVAALVDNPFMTDKRRIQSLYLAGLTRLPDDEELQQSFEWIQECQERGDSAQAFSDLLWALLNSGEFILQR